VLRAALTGLSGAFMICVKLRAKIPCRQTLFEVLAEAEAQGLRV
jgi:hypothetical protein